jgi:TATA-box binding protein (TBP) (component of TFIID and TFIIIB)
MTMAGDMEKNIDKEWDNFLLSGFNNGDVSSDEEEYSQLNELKKNDEDFVSANVIMDINSVAPKATNIYVSTKTKIAYLNTPIELKNIFWNIPIITYSQPINGVIKKQMKFNSLEKEELEFIKNKIVDEPYFEEHIITHIDNPLGRIKFKDIRKISIGISKKDITSYRCKKKSAFYNCFVIILRMKMGSVFKEFHVKVFNTGKLEIPGIQTEAIFQMVLDEVIKTLRPYVNPELGYKPDTNETVLINSNFNCGFFINREILFDTLKFKYNIQAIYDPCSYPGIQCKFYYNPDSDIQNGCQISEENKQVYKNIKEVSFMIFRTGSVLIVGKCDENVLFIIYDFLKIVLNNEYINICQKHSLGEENIFVSSKDKIKKVRRRNIMIEFTSLAN